MLKTILLGSALALTPMLALADQSTDQSTPYTEKTPGNGPTIHRHHHWRADRYMNGGIVEQRTAAEEPVVAESGFVGPGPYRGYGYGGVWTGNSNSPYANMYLPPAAH